MKNVWKNTKNKKHDTKIKKVNHDKHNSCYPISIHIVYGRGSDGGGGIGPLHNLSFITFAFVIFLRWFLHENIVMDQEAITHHGPWKHNKTQ